MTEQQTSEADLYGHLHRVTIASDGGVGGRGGTSVVYMTPENYERLKSEVESLRAL